MGRQHSPFPSSVPAQFPNVPQQQPLTSPPFAALSFAHLGGDAGGNPQSPGASLICGILLSVVSLLFSDMKPKAEPAAWTGTADPWVPVLSSSGEPVPQAGTTSQQTAAGLWDFPPASADPWGKAPASSGFSPADPWTATSPPAQGSGTTPATDPWAAVAEPNPNPGKQLGW